MENEIGLGVLDGKKIYVSSEIRGQEELDEFGLSLELFMSLLPLETGVEVIVHGTNFYMGRFRMRVNTLSCIVVDNKLMEVFWRRIRKGLNRSDYLPPVIEARFSYLGKTKKIDRVVDKIFERMERELG